MKDVQNGLGVKSISDLLGKEIRGTLATNSPTKEEERKYIRSEYQITKNLADNKKISMLGVILWKK